MASRRKMYRRTKQDHVKMSGDEKNETACFIADLLDGTITATAMHEVRNPQGRLLRLEYDDPNG